MAEINRFLQGALDGYDGQGTLASLARELFRRRDSLGNGKGLHWAESLMCVQLDAGGHNFPLIELYAGVEAVMAAVDLLDHLEDSDDDAFIAQHGRAASTNLATWLLVLGEDLVGEADSVMSKSNALGDSLLRVLMDGLLQSACGQHLDLTLSSPSVDEAVRSIYLKAGSLVACICEMGAMAGGWPGAVNTEAFRSLGFHLGVASQLLDDLKDFSIPAIHPARAGELRASITDPTVELIERNARLLILATLASYHASRGQRIAEEIGAVELARLFRKRFGLASASEAEAA